MDLDREFYEDDEEGRNRPFLCTQDNRIKVMYLTDEQIQSPKDCPRCGTRLKFIRTDQELEKYQTCDWATCSQYLSIVATFKGGKQCEGARSDKNGDCNAGPVRLVIADLKDLAPDNEPEQDATLPHAVRQLRAKVWQAKRWVESSGSHHRSTGGPHTGSATQRHTEAHKSKALLRERFKKEITALMEPVKQLGDPYSADLREANNAINAVQNK